MRMVLVALSFVALASPAQTLPQPAQALGAQTTAAEPSRAGSIGGTIRDEVTGAPSPGAIISTIARSNTENATSSKRVAATADADGRYTLPDLPPGCYSLSMHSADRFGPEGARIVTLRAGEALSAIDFALRPFGRISGKILDDNKEPVANAMVYAISKEYASGELQYVIQVGARANDVGEYSLPLLKPGRQYLVRAEKREAQPVSRAPSDPKLRKPALAPAYYQNSPVIEGAIPVVLRVGESRESVDIDMSKAPSYCIEATLEAEGRPAALGFSIMERALSTSSYGLGGKSGPDGKIRICGLPPGEYDVTAEHVPSGTAESPRFGSMAVNIADKDVRNVTVVAYAGVPLRGKVTWDSTPPAKPIPRVWISLEPLTRPSFMGEQTELEVSVPKEFSFPSSLMGEYAVRIGGISSPGIYVKDMVYARRSIRNKSLRLTGSTDIDPELRIILGADGGTLSTTVVDKDGKPIPDSYVLIMPAEIVSEAEFASALVSGQTDQNGRYSSDTLAPGKYYLLASSTPIEPTPESIGPLTRSRVSKATEIDIGAGQSVQLMLTIAPIE
jgi:hypothetical protein